MNTDQDYVASLAEAAAQFGVAESAFDGLMPSQLRAAVIYAMSLKSVQRYREIGKDYDPHITIGMLALTESFILEKGMREKFRNFSVRPEDLKAVLEKLGFSGQIRRVSPQLNIPRLPRTNRVEIGGEWNQWELAYSDVMNLNEKIRLSSIGDPKKRKMPTRIFPSRPSFGGWKCINPLNPKCPSSSGGSSGPLMR